MPTDSQKDHKSNAKFITERGWAFQFVELLTSAKVLWKNTDSEYGTSDLFQT